MLKGLIDGAQATAQTGESAEGLDEAQGRAVGGASFDSAGRVQVYVHTYATGAEELASLEEAGLRVELANADEDIVQGWRDIDDIDDIDGLAKLSFVQLVSLPDYAVPRTGSVTTSGDGISRADVLRNVSGLTGGGIKVGVISTGVPTPACLPGRLPKPPGTFPQPST